MRQRDRLTFRRVYGKVCRILIDEDAIFKNGGYHIMKVCDENETNKNRKVERNCPMRNNQVYLLKR
ncbi:MAG: hypothetical protein GY721_02485 [Deltaproteobacteria bacterium]|nr:hypothetical protein [Deltaproteobacteria bacterium]